MPTSVPVSKFGRSTVSYVRPEVRELLEQYALVRDCIAGSAQVKKGRAKYLPMPNELDDSEEEEVRYKNYIKRAVFFNATKRTVLGMVGQIFLREPQFDLPPGLQILLSDADGSGGTLNQMCEEGSRYVLAYGRAGVFTDFPSPSKPAAVNTLDKPGSPPGAPAIPYFTQAEVDAGDVRPIMKVYDSTKIINWRMGVRGSRSVATLVVLQDENFYAHTDGFQIKSENEYIVLKLLTKEQAAADIAKNGTLNGAGVDYNDLWAESLNSREDDVYKQEVWRWNPASKNIYVEHYYPRDKDGNFMNEIPFRPIGVSKNEFDPTEPPIYDMAEVNIAHYRNSADYEESVFMNGQVTFVATGLTEEWALKFFEKGIGVGSRGVVPLPVGGQAQFLQAAANGIVREAMQDKEKQMVALGAKLIEQRNVARTATEAAIESSSESSILGTIAKNVATAIAWACKDACKFTGDNPDSIVIKLNTEFDLQKMDANERFELLTEWVNGAITFGELRDNFRRGGIANLDDEEAKAALDAEAKERADKAVEQAKAMADAMPKPVVAGNGKPGAAGGDGKVKPPTQPKKPGGGKDANQSA